MGSPDFSPACWRTGVSSTLHRLEHGGPEFGDPHALFAARCDHFGMCSGVFARLGLGRSVNRGEVARLDLVGLGEDEAIADRGNVEHLEYFAVNLLDPVAAVDEDQRAFQHLPSTQIIIDEEAPFPD